MSKKTESDKAEAIARLRKLVKPGDTLKTILRHVSKSGMSRRIDVYKITRRGEMLYLTGLISAACGISFPRNGQGLRMDGCGMDMGFAVVYHVARTLWPKGFGCIGEKCRSNDHSNGDRNREKHTKAKPHWHEDGGYALRHEWI